MPTAWIDPATVTTQPRQENVTVQTTLYDLIASINANIAPEEDHMVIAEVLRLLNAGRINILRR
jgi:hypothetical protein